MDPLLGEPTDQRAAAMATELSAECVDGHPEQDFVEFIESCVDHDVRFLIVGGYALAAHGHPRATKDLDVWVLLERGNAERLIDAFGFGSVELDAVGYDYEGSARRGSRRLTLPVPSRFVGT